MDDLSEIQKLAGVPPLIAPLLMPLSILQQAGMDMITMQTRGEVTATAPVSRTVTPDKRKTRIKTRNDITIRRSEIVLDEDTPGELEELMVRSTSMFSVELHVNGVMAWSKSMAELINLSEDVSGITAVYRDSIYRFGISDIYFESIFIRVYLAGSGTFDTYSRVGPING